MQRLPRTSLAFSFFHATQVIYRVMAGQSLADGLLERVPEMIRPSVQELVYSCLRQFGRGDFFLVRLLRKPLVEPEIHALLLLAISRLELEPEFAHTVVDQAVTTSGIMHNGRFKALTNGVLRAFLRQQPQLQAEADDDAVATHCHPDWWLARLQVAYPAQWCGVAAAGNQRPPMAVRVNRRRAGRDSWLAEFQSIQAGALAWGEDTVLLEQALPVGRLPGFFEGIVSVQDPGAQRAADLLAPASGSRVLDACAAPGGKAAHLLERTDIDLLALDLKPARCRKIADNLHRLGLQAEIKVANCIRLDEWWDRRYFDAVLADVPCTASGVVRRHPDSKWLRREADIASFSIQQSAILDALWQVVKPGGKLLYATCSIFPEENHVQMARFVDRTPDADISHQEQLLPDREHDAFYYCLLEKKP